MRFPIGAMSVGDILDRGLKLLLARLPTLYLINLLFLSPIIVVVLTTPQLVAVLAGNQPTSSAVGLGVGVGLLVLFLTLLLQPLGNAAILHVIAEEFAGRPVGAGAALRFALGRFLPLFGSSLLAGLCVGVGFLLLIVPGIIFLIWFVFVAQIVVVEGISGSPALGRSRALTAGYRGRIFGLLILFGIIGWIVGLVPTAIEKYVLPSYELVPAGPGGARVPVLHYGNYLVTTLLAQLVNILVQCYQAVGMTLVYFDVRIRKEGYDLEMAAEEEATTAP